MDTLAMIEEDGHRPRLWDYPQYTEMHIGPDSAILQHPDELGGLLIRLLKDGPVAVFLGEES